MLVLDYFNLFCNICWIYSLKFSSEHVRLHLCLVVFDSFCVKFNAFTVKNRIMTCVKNLQTVQPLKSVQNDTGIHITRRKYIKYVSSAERWFRL